MIDKFLFKIACDKNGFKLGKIIRIEYLPGKTIKKDVPYAIVHVIKALRIDVKIPVELKKKLKTEGKYVWFNINKSNFSDEVRKQREIKRIKRHMEAKRQAKRKRYWSL